MDHIVLIPHFGAGRGRLARHGRATVYSVADPVASAAFASWCNLVGDRSAADALDDLARLAGRSAVSAVAAFVADGDALEVLTIGGAPITADGSPLASSAGAHRQRVEGATTIELLATGALADDPLLDFEQGVVAADGFTLRRSAAGPTPWETADEPAVQPSSEPAAEPAVELMAEVEAAEMGAPMVAAIDDTASPDEVMTAPEATEPPASTPLPDVVMAEVAAAEMGGAAAVAPEPAAAAANVAGLVSLLEADDDLPVAEPLPVAGGPAPAAAPAEAHGHDHDHPHDHATTPVPVTAAAARPGAVMVAGLRCARDHFNDPRARFCATCGIAMHQASFVLTQDVRPPLGVVTFADGTFYSITGNLVFGRDPDDDPAIRAGSATPAVLIDPANTISRVHAEIRAVEWDVYLVDRGSTNGTFVWNAGAQQWDRLAPDQPRVIEPGAQISFGRLVAAFDSGLRP